MHLASLMEMVESGFDDRVLLGDADAARTGAEFGRAGAIAARPTFGIGHGIDVYVGENHPLLPVALSRRGVGWRAVRADQLPTRRRSS